MKVIVIANHVILPMLYNIAELKMGVGGSGRIVIEIDPNTKRDLYAALHRDGQTLKDWFLDRAEEYTRNGAQLSMFDDPRQGNAGDDGNGEQG